jgi:alpha-L-fucosidase 2
MLRRAFLSLLGSLAALRRVGLAQDAVPRPLTLWYRQPAGSWLEAAPLGNGRIGAMVFGIPGEERIFLNEDTLYSEEPGTRDVNLDITKDFDRVVAWIRNGEYAEADRFVTKHWLGRAQPCYQPLGELRIRFSPTHDVSSYQRELDLANAVARVQYVYSGVKFEREFFTSHPDNILMMRFSAASPGALRFRVTLDSAHPNLAIQPVASNEIAVTGQLPGFALRREFDFVDSKGDAWKYPEIYNPDGTRKPNAARVLYGDAIAGRGMRFEVRIQARVEGGSVASGEDGLMVQDASTAVLLVAVSSSFNGADRSPTREGADASARNRTTLAACSGKSYEEMRAAHIQDYRSLFDRVQLELGETPDRPSDQRLRNSPSHSDPALDALHFQFGRYLMIAGSRPGTQPLNLQGIWNVDVIPPWAGAYTTNINIQMNYWPAESTNLSECHEPLFRMLRELAVTGGEVAKEMYNLPGWVLHHNTTIWRDAQPVDNLAEFAFWPMASGWFCQHLWEHYLYTRDREFLRNDAYPVMKGAAEFYAGWLRDDGAGRLTTPVSTSPENEFYYTDANGHKQQSGVAQGTTLDIAIIRELFTNVIEASRMLTLDASFRDKLSAQLARLPEYQVGKHGQLLEWHKEFEEYPPRHDVSPYYPLYPGKEITPATPRLFEAERVFVTRRNKVNGGWPGAWTSCCWSRLGDAERAYASYRSILTRSTHPNFFNGNGTIFQIDGNLGGTAAVVEMLLQSHTGELHLPPALPDAWKNGRVSGLVARGGFEVSMSWSAGRLQTAEVRFRHDGVCKLRYRDRTIELKGLSGQRRRLNAELEVLGA